MKKKLINILIIYIILFIILINNIDKNKSWNYIKKNYKNLNKFDDYLIFPILNIIIIFISFIIGDCIN
jgi:hypothetical protein